MILGPRLETGVGDIDGDLTATVSDGAAVAVLAQEWEHLRQEGLGGVYLTVTQQACPFLEAGQVSFSGTYQLLLLLERALVANGLSRAVAFEFEPAPSEKPEPAGWIWIDVSVEPGQAVGFAKALEDQFPSRAYFRDLRERQGDLDKLRETGRGTVLLHSRYIRGIERRLRWEGFEFEFVSRFLTANEVESLGLSAKIHHVDG